MTPYLSLAIWVPIVAGVAVLAIGRDRDAMTARWIALAGALAGFLVTIPLYTHFDLTTSAMQFVEHRDWIPYFDIYYHLGVDGISVLFILLNSFITLLVVWAGWEVIKVRVAQYMAAFLIMSGLINGAFAALDAILFYVFFEAMLIPMYLIIGIWGGAQPRLRRRQVLPVHAAGLAADAGRVHLPVPEVRQLRAAGLVRAAAVAQDADADLRRVLRGVRGQGADVAGAHVAAGRAPRGADRRLGRAGGDHAEDRRVRLRALHPADPAGREPQPAVVAFIITLSLIAVVYIGFVALVQADMKRLIAYSSISHMGFVTLGFFLFSVQGVEGGLAQMISHGFVSAAMFLCVGVLYDRMHTHLIADYGGVANTMPKFAAFVMLFSMANAGLPATSGFVGEFLVILAAVKVNFWIAFLAALSLILGAAYTLWMYKRVIYGDVANAHVAALKDLSRREFWLLGTLAAAVLVMGVWPKPFIDVMHVSVADLLAHVAKSKTLTRAP